MTEEAAEIGSSVRYYLMRADSETKSHTAVKGTALFQPR